MLAFVAAEGLLGDWGAPKIPEIEPKSEEDADHAFDIIEERARQPGTLADFDDIERPALRTPGFSPKEKHAANKP